MKSALSVAIGIVAACSVSIAAQWPKYPTPDVPRDAQGRGRMAAPPPRTAEGKRDLSGIWTRADREPIGGGRGRGRGGQDGRGAGQDGRGGQDARAGGPPPAVPSGIPVEPPTQPFPPDP